MEINFSIFLIWTLGGLCLYVFLRSLFSKDKTKLWSPISFLSLFYLYYCVIPHFNTSRIFEGIDTEKFSLSFHAGALLSYISVLIGFSWFGAYGKKRTNWKFLNNCISYKNAKRLSFFLMAIALLCYVPFREFSLSFFFSESDLLEYDWDDQGFAYYFVGAISLLVTSCCASLVVKKNKLVFLAFLWVTLVTYIISGFRYRIVILVIALFTTFYLSDIRRKVNYLYLVLVASVCYVGFNVMDHTRYYGNGINIELFKDIANDDLTRQAGETERVYNFSILVMDKYEVTGKREYFAPIVNAFFMPLPRSLFPWKPKAEYMYEATDFVMRGRSGSAYLNFVEAFMAFGWLGIIVNGLIIGWLSRKFWNNYRNNKDSVGAIILLGLYNGMTYVFISRGYLAQQYNCFLYFVVLPFIMMSLLKRVR